MAVVTMKVLASLLQLHGPGATIESDHPGINAVLDEMRGPVLQEGAAPAVTEVAFRRGAFAKGAAAGGFRKTAAAGGAAFRRGAFRRY
jgi:hypothetical protein